MRYIKYSLLIILVCWGLFAKAEDNMDELDNYTFLEMIYSVDLEDQSSFIQKFQDKEAREKLMDKFGSEEATREGFKLQTYRNKEVILVSIPAKYLFASNEVQLLDNAGTVLAPFKRYLKDPDTYRVLLVMHTDNTGSETYRDRLTEDRVNAVFEWFEDSGADTSYLFPYAMGDEIPTVEKNVTIQNNSYKNREKNRRLEIYLMPGKKMLKQAKKGKIDF